LTLSRFFTFGSPVIVSYMFNQILCSLGETPFPVTSPHGKATERAFSNRLEREFAPFKPVSSCQGERGKRCGVDKQPPTGVVSQIQP
jgi:hypothetical protein